MKDTIKAKEYYHVRRVNKAIPGYDDPRLVMDGNNVVMLADYQSYGEYKYNRDNNECFRFCERFTTKKGNTFIYWRDEEIDADYITQD